MTRHAEKESTCTEEGNIEYWSCSTCAKNYNDEAGTIVVEDVKTDKAEHAYGDDNTCDNCAASRGTSVTFEFGDNKAVDSVGDSNHVDGSSLGTSKSYTVNGYTLDLQSMSKVYGSAYDGAGNSCIKLGTKDTAGSFMFTVPDDVTSVTIFVAKYKTSATTVAVAGEPYTLTKNSNDGEYDVIVVDTSSEKTISFSVSSGKRCMINTIVFNAGVNCEHTNREAGETVEATCTEKGYTSYTCPDCGLTFNWDYTDALQHDVSFVPEVASNCVDNGNVQHWHCDRCGNNYAEEAATTLLDNVNKAVDPSNHMSLESIEVTPTCTETGLTGGERCTACDTVTREPEIVNATGHIDTTGDGLCDNEGCDEPTCPGHEAEEEWKDDGTGNTHIKRCIHCSAILETEEHSMIDNIVAPTCTSGGYTKHTCADCGYTYDDSEKDALGHNLVYVNDGNSHHQECDRENCEYATAAENHTYSSLKDKDATYHTASCICSASKDEEHVNNGTGNCNCGHVMVVQTTTITKTMLELA